MLPHVDVEEVARLARAMTWKFAACRVPYAGAKAGVRFRGGDRAAVLTAYKRALDPHRDAFLTGPDMGTSPADFLQAVRTRCRSGPASTRAWGWTTSPPGTASRRPPRRPWSTSAGRSRGRRWRSRASGRWARARLAPSRARGLGWSA